MTPADANRELAHRMGWVHHDEPRIGLLWLDPDGVVSATPNYLTDPALTLELQNAWHIDTQWHPDTRQWAAFGPDYVVRFADTISEAVFRCACAIEGVVIDE